jgi:hypothetical protein
MGQWRIDCMTAEAAKINTPNPISVTQSCVAKAGGTEWLIIGAHPFS